MTKVLEQAIEKVKSLPEERQRQAAEVVELIASAPAARFYDRMTPEQRAELMQSIAEADRGEVVDEAALDRELDALFARRA